MSLVVHKLVLSPGGATATTAQPTTAHHVTLSAYTHARSNATDNMGRVLDGPPSSSMSTPPASSSPYSSSSSNSSSTSSSKHSSTYNLPFVLQDHNYGAPPPPTPPHSPPPCSSSSSNTSSSSGSIYQHHHYQQQQQQQHQYHHPHHHHHLHHQTYQSTTLAPSSSTTSLSSPSSSISHHHTSSSTIPHHQLHHHHHHLHHQPTTTTTATTITAHHLTTTANTHHHHHQQQQHQHQHQHYSTTTTTSTTTTPHLQQKHHHFIQHPGPSPRLGCSSSSSSSISSSVTTTSSSSTTNSSSSSAASFSSSSLSVGGVMTHHPLSNMPPHRQQFMPHPKSSIIFPSPHIPPPPVELPQHTPQSLLATTTGPPPALLPSTETDDDSRLSDRSSSVGPSGEETETAPEGEGDDLPADDSITRCVCDFSHDDGYMIQCDRCFVWQHVDCMEIDRDNIPDEYLCEACDPRPIDRFKARALQIRRRQEIKAHLARLSSSDSEDNMPMSAKRGSLGKVQERKVVKKKKVKQIKDMKNGRKGGGSGNGTLSLLKKGGIGSNNSTTTTSCNNTLLPAFEDKDRRMLVKRRRKSNSQSGGEGVSDDSSGGPVERLRAWVEGYEAAVTNHYSPELRARVHAARINGVSPDLRASTQGAVLGHRCRVASNPQPLFDVFDSKILVAATRLVPNTAITEFQGKYLLASQWNAQQPVSSQPYLPYVLQYHMPKEGLTVCVDARTYGNDARFTRHSCTPNAEVRHVVERGSLHLYIVATREIEEGEEVTLSLETANSTLELVCCLAEEHDCRAPPSPRPEQTPSAPALTHKKNGLIVGNKKTFKKQQLQLQLRTSKRTASADTRLMEPAPITTPVIPTTPIPTVKQRRASGCGKSPVKSPSTASVTSSPEEGPKDTSSITPGPCTPSAATVNVTSPPDTPRTALDKQQQQKMTREERKIAAYMKAFERLEKAAQRRQEMEKKKEEDKGKEGREPKEKDKKRCDGDEEDWEKTSSADECVRSLVGADRCRRKGKKGRGKGSPQKRSNHRTDSAASDLTGDESSCASVGLMSPSGGATMESIALNFNSPPQGNPNAMGFRFPKTKKALMNEWLNENVDPVVPAGSVVGTDLPSGVPPCYMRSPAMPLRRSSLNQTTGPGAMPVQDVPGCSAKKRWLRQAISEETETPQFNGLCPSPNSRPDSPTGVGDYITPLKKRRLARESMSSELSSTPPSTPVHSTSMEEDKMVEEMEAELAEEEDSHKPKSNHRYSEDQPTSPSIQDTNACSGFLITAIDTSSSSSSRTKRVVVQEDEEEEEEDLVIDEDGSFFDQGRGAVNFSKVACERLSQNQAEKDQQEEEEEEARGGLRGKTRRGKKVCYKPEEEEEEAEREEDDTEEKHEEEEKQIVVDDNDGETFKPKRRQYGMKKGRNQQQQQAIKRGKRQQGVMTKKGKQDFKIKTGVKRRKPVKRGKEVTLSEEEEENMEGEEDDIEREEEDNIEREEEKIEKEEEEEKIEKEEQEQKIEREDDAEKMERVEEVEKMEREEEGEKMEKEKEKQEKKEEEEEETKIADNTLQRVKEEPSQTGIKPEITEPNIEPICKVEPKRDNENQEQPKTIKTEIAVKKEEEEKRSEPEVKTEPQECVEVRLDNTKLHQETEHTSMNTTEHSDNTKNTEEVSRAEKDKMPLDETVTNVQDETIKKEEEEKKEEEDTLRPNTDEEKITGTVKSSEDNQEQLCPTTVSSEAGDRRAKVEEESVMAGVQEEIKIDGKKKEKAVVRKIQKLSKVMKKDKEPRQKWKGGNESKEKPAEEEDITPKESMMQVADTQKEDDMNDKQTERRENEQSCVPSSLRERSKSPSLDNKDKRKDNRSSWEESPTPLEKTPLRPVRDVSPVERTRDSQMPTKENVNTTTTTHCKDDASTTIIPEIRWKLDLPLKTDEHFMEVIRKPPTPPTLFPPLPWQTNPESFADTDPLRPKTPESVNYLGGRGPRTPEGPAPTSPSNSPTSLPTSPPRSPLTTVGGSEETKSDDKSTGENAIEGTWRPRARGPCTPPSPPPLEATQEEQQQEGGEEANSSPSHQHHSSNTESTQKRPAPVKKKLSILEYRKRKSVGGETGPLDSSPPPCPPPHHSLGGDSSGSAHESSMHGGLHSPSQSSPPGLTGGSEDGDSSPDLPLSPIGPILLPPSPINLDTRSSLEETKRDGETYRTSATGTVISSDLSRHSIINKITSTSNSSSSSSSNNSSSSKSNNSTNNSNNSNTSGSSVVSEASTTLTATTTTSTTTASHSLHTITGGNAQDVKWNAAPTLLERQRENLTARLRREFGLCVADDDDDKSGLRLSCSGVLSRPSPPVLPPTTPLTTSSPLSPRARKPPVLTVGQACMSYLTEGEDRGHRRHKNLLPPPPPPPPPTAQPKNSIFHGREVMEPRVVCGVKVGVTGTGQLEGATTGGHVVSASQRLIGSTGLFPPSVPPPAPPSVRVGSLSQGTVPASAGIPNMLTGVPGVPRPCPVPPPIGVPPVPTLPVVQAGLAVLPAVPHGLPGLPPSKQPGPCLSPALTVSQQNPEYPGRSFPRGQFGVPGLGTLTSPISIYSAARLAPPPPPPLPPPPPVPRQTDPVGTGLRGPSPPGHADPARVGGEGSAGYSGQDCSAPGTRGS